MYSTVVVAAGASERRRLLKTRDLTMVDLTVVNLLGSPAGGRRLLPAFDWGGAIDLLDAALLGGNYASLNEMASALILEVDSQYGETTLTATEALSRNLKPETLNPRP